MMPSVSRERKLALQMLALPVWLAGWVISQRRAKGGGTTEVLDYTDSDTCLRLAISAYLPCAYLTIKR